MHFTKKENLISLLFWFLLFFWGGLIFDLSFQPANQSNDLSLSLTMYLINIIEKWLPFEVETSTVVVMADQLNHIIRKLAHGASYFVLGLLSVNAFRRTKGTAHRAYLLSALFCILFAISDELHQIFVPGRSGELRDVLIDSTGALLAICLCWGIGKIHIMKSRSGRA